MRQLEIEDIWQMANICHRRMSELRLSIYRYHKSRLSSNAQYVYDEPEIGEIRPLQPHIQRRVKDVLAFKRPPGRSLDVGCGKGETALALAAQGFPR